MEQKNKVCNECGQETLKCNCVDVGTMNKEEQIARLKKDIKDLKEKLLFVVTKSVKKNLHEGKNIAETQRKTEVRQLRNLLKDKLLTYQLIREAEDITKV